MLFNSLEFFLFFIIVFSLYLILRRYHTLQNRMLLAASYVFYGAWDWRFLSLIIISTAVDYYCGLKIHEEKKAGKKKRFLWISVFTNLSLLGFFKYFDFFLSSFYGLLNAFGIHSQPRLLNIILPVGISFYTFQTLSYTIDIYRGELKPTKKFFDFALFVAFFPQLVAGPIERAKRLLPQILNPRELSVSGFREGCFLIFWGLFEKMFVAGTLAKVVDPVFAGHAPYQGAVVVVSLYAFAFQIFCDFDGYSNIARGLGKCMGIELMVNFNLPYAARNPREFWQRWHISLSTWLRDYLYIPLGGNRGSRQLLYRNLIITMLLGGLWHGAEWTFVLWGAYQGLLLVVHRWIISRNPGSCQNVKQNVFLNAFKVFLFFNLVCVGWLFFRAQSLLQVGQMFRSVFFNFHLDAYSVSLIFKVFAILLPLLVVQLGQLLSKNLMFLYVQHWFIKIFSYALMTYLILGWGVLTAEEFIYFQF